jgi:hypothetical protein
MLRKENGLIKKSTAVSLFSEREGIEKPSEKAFALRENLSSQFLEAT